MRHIHINSREDTCTLRLILKCQLNIIEGLRTRVVIGAIKVLCWANNVIDLPVCTFFGSELAPEIPPAGLK